MQGEPAFAPALTARALTAHDGLPADDLWPATGAAMLNAALRVAAEHYAWHTADPDPDPDPDHDHDPATAEAELTATIRSALGVAARG
ncbi:hypothetical protein [Streptomyces sp. NPDC006997]|uniref:hypothetical protein n=1 Tax=Streptomyces sp. NPDC006997 TaxID=3155356 RepID=UPI0033E457A9